MPADSGHATAEVYDVTTLFTPRRIEVEATRGNQLVRIVHPFPPLGNCSRRAMSHPAETGNRLYVSEATFHRTRRNAPRAVAKAPYEMGLPAHLQN